MNCSKPTKHWVWLKKYPRDTLLHGLLGWWCKRKSLVSYAAHSGLAESQQNHGLVELVPFGTGRQVSFRCQHLRNRMGSYRYLQGPQGFHASGDHYTKQKYEITKDIKIKREIIDDTLVFEDSLKKLFWTTMWYIKSCADNGIICTPKKFHFGEEVTLWPK